jgi:hypothetical protein
VIEIVGMLFALFAGLRALATALVFTQVCAGVLAVLVLCAVTMNWPWIPVVAVIVWHVSDLRHAIWRRQS